MGQTGHGLFNFISFKAFLQLSSFAETPVKVNGANGSLGGCAAPHFASRLAAVSSEAKVPSFTSNEEEGAGQTNEAS